MNVTLPKLSYVLMSHNRAHYLRQAMESAFAQVYDGELEFIFSDDCSTDGSYELMQECAGAYRGPHRVILTKTPHNLHLAGHTNHALQFVTSDWIVRADDDDLSHQDRCQHIGQAIARHPQCRYVVHGLKHFTDAEEEEACRASKRSTGAAVRKARVLDPCAGYKVVDAYQASLYSYNVWHMDVYRVFGDLQLDGYYVDDLCSYFRANILGYGLLLEEPLHFIRCGCNNMCRGGSDGSRGYQSIMQLEQFHDRYYNMTMVPLLMDLESFKRYAKGKAGLHDYLEELEAEMEKRKDLASYWRLGTLNRLQLLRKYGRWDVFSLLRCLPMPLFASAQALYRKLFS